MANSPSFTRAMVKSLLTTIKERMPSIIEAYDDFPAANQTLKFPSFSIFTREPKYTPGQIYILKVGDVINDDADPDNGKAPVDYVIGKYDFNFQLDFWCESKFQRHDIFEEFVQAFNDLNPTGGINLKLTDYYDQFVHIDSNSLNFEQDSEISSQRGEWRVIVEITGSASCIKRKMENIMQTIEQQVETTEGDLP